MTGHTERKNGAYAHASTSERSTARRPRPRLPALDCGRVSAAALVARLTLFSRGEFRASAEPEKNLSSLSACWPSGYAGAQSAGSRVELPRLVSAVRFSGHFRVWTLVLSTGVRGLSYARVHNGTPIGQWTVSRPVRRRFVVCVAGSRLPHCPHQYSVAVASRWRVVLVLGRNRDRRQLYACNSLIVIWLLAESKKRDSVAVENTNATFVDQTHSNHVFYLRMSATCQDCRGCSDRLARSPTAISFENSAWLQAPPYTALSFSSFSIAIGFPCRRHL
ncbi:uncharacterized protein LOC112598109 isoform X1 [Melanaphis sacchari]|uniref:uncharacterized protein LOC112598109 isoform X1 n=1 Tax=Melanaphis sacchari TaxID=742174 RepID=UPI000DC14966|nr:uncharacterized protein LOC112598109 isoform X1 [Melanaphis sacchari]XP_025200246.1 uncharacterized protein LOC112598109 isoform X1 [Melanaphis sacchari]